MNQTSTQMHKQGQNYPYSNLCFFFEKRYNWRDTRQACMFFFSM